MAFFNFPHTRTYDTDLGWIILRLNEISKQLSEYLENAVITFADPITWDITEQYTALTCVVDTDGTAYLSKQPVPAGVDISNTNYWLPIFNYDDNINTLRDQIAVNARVSATTPAALTKGDLVFWNGYLYRALTDMPAGTAFIIDTNVERYSVDDKIDDILTETSGVIDTKIEEVTTEFNTQIGDVRREISNLDTEVDGKITNLTNGTTNFSLLNYQTPSYLSHYFDKITMKDSNNTEYDVLVKGNLFNHIDTDVVIPQMYGAVGDGVADDTEAVRSFFNACLNGAVGFVPPGTYKCTSQIIIDYSIATKRQLKITGAGCYRAIFRSTITAGTAFLFTGGTQSDSFHTVISDVGFSADFGGTTLQLGKNDRTDSIGNANFTNVFITNTNTGVNSGAVAARYNYIFDCVFNNVVYVCGSNGAGTSLILVLARFCTFIGGSYSNANIAIHFPSDNYCDTLTFIGSDFENINYGVYLEGNAQYIKFITCYFDIWRPDLNPPTYGKNAIYSNINAAAIGCVQFENCLFARAGIYGPGGLDLEHINKVRVNGIYSFSDPKPPANGGTWVNNTGQDQFIFISTLNADEDSAILWYNILNYIFPDNTVNVQCGFGGSKTVTCIVPAGSSFQIGYNGTIYWKVRPYIL